MKKRKISINLGWKKEAILEANTPINKTLRPIKKNQ